MNPSQFGALCRVEFRRLRRTLILLCLTAVLTAVLPVYLEPLTALPLHTLFSCLFPAVLFPLLLNASLADDREHGSLPFILSLPLSIGRLLLFQLGMRLAASMLPVALFFCIQFQLFPEMPARGQLAIGLAIFIFSFISTAFGSIVFQSPAGPLYGLCHAAGTTLAGIPLLAFFPFFQGNDWIVMCVHEMPVSLPENTFSIYLLFIDSIWLITLLYFLSRIARQLPLRRPLWIISALWLFVPALSCLLLVLAVWIDLNVQLDRLAAYPGCRSAARAVLRVVQNPEAPQSERRYREKPVLTRLGYVELPKSITAPLFRQIPNSGSLTELEYVKLLPNNYYTLQLKFKALELRLHSLLDQPHPPLSELLRLRTEIETLPCRLPEHPLYLVPYRSEICRTAFPDPHADWLSRTSYLFHKPQRFWIDTPLKLPAAIYLNAQLPRLIRKERDGFNKAAALRDLSELRNCFQRHGCTDGHVADRIHDHLEPILRLKTLGLTALNFRIEQLRTDRIPSRFQPVEGVKFTRSGNMVGLALSFQSGYQPYTLKFPVDPLLPAGIPTSSGEGEE